MSYSSLTGFDRICGLLRWTFRAANAFSHSGVHSNLFPPLSMLKKGAHLLLDFDINLFSATTLPAKLWTSLGILGPSYWARLESFLDLSLSPSGALRTLRTYQPLLWMCTWEGLATFRTFELCGHSVEVLGMVLFPDRLDQHVIDVYLHNFPNLFFEYHIY